MEYLLSSSKAVGYGSWNAGGIDHDVDVASFCIHVLGSDGESAVVAP